MKNINWAKCLYTSFLLSVLFIAVAIASPPLSHIAIYVDTLANLPTKIPQGQALAIVTDHSYGLYYFDGTSWNASGSGGGGGGGGNVTASSPLVATTSNGTTNLAFATTGAIPVINGGTGYFQTGNAGLSNILGGTAQLPHWNTALARVMSGKGNARILCLGDSITQGYWSTNSGSGPYAGLSFCGQLSNAFNSIGLPSSTDDFIGNADGTRSTATDTRMVVGTGWASVNPDLTLGGEAFNASSATTSLAYTPSKAVDTFVIWWPRTSGQGTLNWNIDGGSNTGIAEAGADGYAKSVITTTLGSHTLNLNRGSGNVYVGAVEAYDSTTSQILVENGGINGAKAADWAGNSFAYSPGPACGTFAADLVIINLQLNDMQFATALNTYKTNLASVATQCQSGGATDILFMTSNHSNPADPTNPVSEVTQATYANAIRALAATTTNSSSVVGVPVADEFSNFVSYTFQNSTLGAVYHPGTWPDDLHLNYIGYGIMARDLIQVLAPNGGNPSSSAGSSSNLTTNNLTVNGTATVIGNAAFAGTLTTTGNVGLGGTTSSNVSLNINEGATTFGLVISSSSLADMYLNATGTGGDDIGFQSTNTANSFAHGLVVNDQTSSRTPFAILGSTTTAPVTVTSGMGYCWATSSQFASGSADTCLWRSGADTINFGNGTSQDNSAQIVAKLYNISTTAAVSGGYTGISMPSTNALALTASGNSSIVIAATGIVTLPNITTDATHTDATVCEDTTSHGLYFGSGTLGICLGTSSARYKKDIIPMTDGLDQIEALKPVNYYYIAGHGDNGAKQQYGFLAEDVVKVLPKLTAYDKDNKPNSVDILGMVPVAIAAIQELQNEIRFLAILFGLALVVIALSHKKRK